MWHMWGQVLKDLKGTKLHRKVAWTPILPTTKGCYIVLCP